MNTPIVDAWEVDDDTGNKIIMASDARKLENAARMLAVELEMLSLIIRPSEKVKQALVAFNQLTKEQ